MVFPLVNNINTSSNCLNCQVEVAKKVRIQTQVFRAPPHPSKPLAGVLDPFGGEGPQNQVITFSICLNCKALLKMQERKAHTACVSVVTRSC